jgi:hypothetical protein
MVVAEEKMAAGTEKVVTATDGTAKAETAEVEAVMVLTDESEMVVAATTDVASLATQEIHAP